MDRIICLVGESGSGKTSIAKRMEQDGYNIIHSYTTRPPREHNEWGHTFKTFEDEWERIQYFKNLEDDNNMIAFGIFGGCYYWAERHQYQGHGDSVYVVDPQGIYGLYKRTQDAEIIPIYLKVDKDTRYCRLVEEWSAMVGLTEANQTAKNRITRDAGMFDMFPCRYVIDNNYDIDTCIKRIYQVLSLCPECKWDDSDPRDRPCSLCRYHYPNKHNIRPTLNYFERSRLE